MISISLPDFVDFALASGPAKIRAARPPTANERDFYAPLVAWLQTAHAAGNLEGAELPTELVADRRKGKVYPALLEAYRSWVRSAEAVWCAPPTAIWEPGSGVRVDVAPPLGLMVSGDPCIVQPHFSGALASNERAIVTCAALIAGLGDKLPSGTSVALLDVPQRRLRVAERRLDALFAGEAAALAAIRAAAPWARAKAAEASAC